MTRTEISEIGKAAFIDRILAPVGVLEEDAVVVDNEQVITTATLLEGVDFDLVYTPLVHLGRKAVVAAVARVVAMNGVAENLTFSAGISARFSVEEVESLVKGVGQGCDEYNVKLLSVNVSASMSGLVLHATAIGSSSYPVYRSGAQVTDLVCVSGGLGGAYMGLKLLEREKRAVGQSGVKPVLEGYTYLLRRQLAPVARIDIVEQLDENDITPTSMINVAAGLSSAVLTICKSSDCGIRIYLERLPVPSESFALGEEMGIDPVVAALNGGDDFELLFTAPITAHEKLLAMGVDIIGHIVAKEKGAALTTPDNSDIELQSPDFK